MPLLFLCEVFGAVRVPKEMWVICSHCYVLEVDV